MAEIDARIPLMYDTSNIYDPNKAQAEAIALKKGQQDLQRGEFEQKMQPYKEQEAKDSQQLNALKVAAEKNDYALKLLDAAQDPQQWQAVRAHAIESGLASPNEIPAIYSPGYIQKARMAHMSFKDRLSYQLQSAELALRGEDLKIRRDERKEDREADRKYKRDYLDILRAKAGATVDPDTGEIVAVQKGKSLPVGALNIQEAALDNLATANSISADIKAYNDQIKTGKLDLSLLGNLGSKTRNFVGMSTPESQNFSSFLAGLEKLRNDSLRLNKGVQTEGDAQRAWNELFQNLNDPKVVSQRLQELDNINQRAAAIQKAKIRTVRENYGAKDLDYSKFEDLGAAPVGGGKGGRLNSASDEEILKALGL